MAIHENDDMARTFVSERLPSGVESDLCQELAAKHQELLLRERAARRAELEQMSKGSPRDPYEQETPDMPEVRI
jgi:hypothetical protein